MTSYRNYSALDLRRALADAREVQRARQKADEQIIDAICEEIKFRKADRPEKPVGKRKPSDIYMMDATELLEMYKSCDPDSFTRQVIWQQLQKVTNAEVRR